MDKSSAEMRPIDQPHAAGLGGYFLWQLVCAASFAGEPGGKVLAIPGWDVVGMARQVDDGASLLPYICARFPSVSGGFPVFSSAHWSRSGVR